MPSGCGSFVFAAVRAVVAAVVLVVVQYDLTQTLNLHRATPGFL